jgi:hypothetical protein
MAAAAARRGSSLLSRCLLSRPAAAASPAVPSALRRAGILIDSSSPGPLVNSTVLFFGCTESWLVLEVGIRGQVHVF